MMNQNSLFPIEFPVETTANVKVEEKNPCLKCPLIGRPILNTIGDLSIAKLFVIGLAPSASDEKLGKIFSSNSGLYVKKLLAKIGFKDEDLAFGSLCKCRTTSNRMPSEKTKKQCNKYLVKELKQFNGLVLALGNTPTKELAGRILKNIRGCGYTIEEEDYYYQVLPTWDPDWVLLQKSVVEAQFEEDIRKAYISVYFPLKLGYRLVNTTTDLGDFLDWLEDVKGHEIAFDIETTGLDGNKDKILTMGFSDGCENFVLPYAHKDSVWKITNQLEFIDDLLKMIFSDLSYKFIMQYAQFDMGFVFKSLGIQVLNLYYDTMVAEYYTKGKFTPMGLKQMVWKYTDFGGYEIPNKKLENEPLEDIAKYNAYDVNLTKLIKDKQWKDFDKRLKNCLTKVVAPAIMAISEMENFGMNLDSKVLNEYTDKYIKTVTELEHKMYTHPAVIDFEKTSGNPINFKSTDQLGKLLKMIGVSTNKFTEKTGKMATDAKSLKGIKNKPSFVADLLEYRKNEKILSTYLRKYNEDNIDGKIHCNYSFVRTFTSRLSSLTSTQWGRG